MEEYRQEIENLKTEIREMREEIREIKAIVSPISTLLKGNGFKLAVVLFASGMAIAMVGVGHLFAVVGSYLVQLVKAFRG